jgi:hypothetical protein
MSPEISLEGATKLTLVTASTCPRRTVTGNGADDMVAKLSNIPETGSEKENNRTGTPLMTRSRGCKLSGITYRGLFYTLFYFILFYCIRWITILS